MHMFILAAILAQEAPKIDEIKVSEAIRRGIDWLKPQGVVNDGGNGTLELVLLTLLHGGVKKNDPRVKELLEQMLAKEPEFTYRTALRAMVLEELQRVKHQAEIHKCAQFLLDNQTAQGIWSYGTKTTYTQVVPTPKDPVASGGPKVVGFGEPEPGVKPKVLQKVPVKKNREMPGGGDNSNSQYAALGLRACHDAGIVLPVEAVRLSQKWWRDQQSDPDAKDGGYGGAGWGYGGKSAAAWGSMTVGATGSLAICDYILGENWKGDKACRMGAEWIGFHFKVEDNPKHENPGAWHYYYLYGLERAGVLYDTPKFGKWDWYAYGAKFLLEQQKPEGHWGDLTNTCFAILFLKRATRPLVASEGRRKP
ncbi:MAG TPA: hypothetical protein VF950_06695 [Planctomycetota bacterium]